MFYSLTGTIVFTDDQCAAISCNGVAFQCFTSRNTLAQLRDGEEVTLYTHLAVREDGVTLYGFFSTDELAAFRMLIGISNVGPKVAIAILSALTTDDLVVAISAGDDKKLCIANGVGPKLAKRIILELKDKIAGASFVSDTASNNATAAAQSGKLGSTAEAVAALVALGYSQSEASVAVGKLDPSIGVEEMIRQALKSMTIKF